MGITHGRAITDISTYKSIGGIPYTNLIAITGVIHNLLTTYQLITPNPVISTLPQFLLTTASTVFVASTSISDTALGTGARLVVIAGLNENYQLTEELVIMNGQTPVETTKIFIRILDLSVVAFGTNTHSTGDSNCVGDIYVGTGIFTAGIPTNKMISVLASENDVTSRQAVFTVPDGKLLLIKDLFCGADPDKKENYSLIIQVCLRFFFEGITVWRKFPPFYFDGLIQYKPEFNFPIPPRTDVQIRAKSSIANAKSSTLLMSCELKDLR